jgi:hypothetical protein
MGIEYKIRCSLSAQYDPSNFFARLPSPIKHSLMQEIYNYAIEPDGFYFVDHLVDKEIASVALRLFIDEALSQSKNVEISEP